MMETSASSLELRRFNERYEFSFKGEKCDDNLDSVSLHYMKTVVGICKIGSLLLELCICRLSSVFSILLLLLRDSSNFKIRIQAAAALAVPETIKDYGNQYYDVVKSVEHVVESFKSDQISEPSNFKYLIALEKQLTSTMLHLLGLASKCDQRAIQDFLVKKASFLEDWIEGLCSSLGDTSNSLDEAKHASVDQKKDVIYRTIQSLIEVYESSNNHQIAQRFQKLGSSLN